MTTTRLHTKAPTCPADRGNSTGVIEGACRHLVKDRLDLTGARWGLHGAQAILKLRALRSNGDFDEYWDYHLDQERQRNHLSLYADNTIPQAT
jgi:hypothetical protein